MNEYIREINEIKYFSKLVTDFIEKTSLEDATRLLCKKLWGINYENSLNDNGSERITKLKFILSNIGLYKDYRYQHDILAYIVKALNLYDGDIIRKNVLSCSELRAYDPVKNGQNILKHDISFNEFTDGGCSYFGNLIIPIRDGRTIFFAKLKGNGEYGFCICEKSQGINSGVVKEIELLCKKIIGLKDELTWNEVQEIIKEELSKIEFPQSPKLRMISAMKFTKENYKQIIEATLKKDKLISKEILECFIDDACKQIEDFISIDKQEAYK